MREYKVIYCNWERDYIECDGEEIKVRGSGTVIQTELLNKFAKEGWRLVQTAYSYEERYYLFLEREV